MFEDPEKIDVCIITRCKVPRKCIQAIKQHIPYNKIIISNLPSRGAARQECIEQVSTEKFAFVDDDVIVTKNWFEKMNFWLNKLNAGAVTGVPRLYPKTPARRYMKLLNEISIDFKSLPQPVDCLHTGACLIRTEAIEGIKIPSCIHHREDLYITEYIKSKGFECWRVPVPFKHYAGGSWETIYAENIANLKLLNKLDTKAYLKKIFGSWLVVAKILVKCREPRVVYWNVPRMFSIIRGYDWRRYAFVKP